MKVNKFIKFVFLILILSFAFLIIGSESGYYEYEIAQNTRLTEESIRKFEEDVEQGKSIDINDYLVAKKTDYNNSISTFGNKVSKGIEDTVSKGFSFIFNYLSKQIEKEETKK